MKVLRIQALSKCGSHIADVVARSGSSLFTGVNLSSYHCPIRPIDAASENLRTRKTHSNLWRMTRLLCQLLQHHILDNNRLSSQQKSIPSPIISPNIWKMHHSFPEQRDALVEARSVYLPGEMGINSDKLTLTQLSFDSGYKTWILTSISCLLCNDPNFLNHFHSAKEQLVSILRQAVSEVTLD